MSRPQRPDFSLESQLLDAGYRCIGGVDEAGRGALAGPLAVSLVIFPVSLFPAPPEPFQSINDSKKLSVLRRHEALAIAAAQSLVCSTVFIAPEEIDEYNVNEATRRAILRLLESSPVTPDMLLIDGTFRFALPVAARSIKYGDSRSLSIAAASVASKVRRDTLMESLDAEFPGYDLAVHKGYGTRRHLECLATHGPSACHRLSYAPVAQLLGAAHAD